jgi:signal transduction histidine kinase
MIGKWEINIYVVASLSAVVCGLLIAGLVWRYARVRPAARSFAIMTACGSLWCLFPTVASLPLDPRLNLLLARLTYIPGAFTVASFLHLAFMMCEDPRKEVRRRALLVAYGLAGFFTIASLSPYYIKGLIRYAPHFAVIGGPIYHAFVLFYLICAGYALVVTIFNLRLTTGHKRDQLRYFLVASALLALSPGLHFAGYYFKAEPIPHDFIVPIFAAMMTYAIVKHQVLDIRFVLRKSLVYSVLIAAITASYLAMVMVVERWFQGFFGYQSVFFTVAVAFLIAVFFNPVRELLQAIVDRWLFKATPVELAEQREHLLTEVRKGEQMKAVATLAAGLAHEIKNPLASIKTFTEYLDNNYADPEFRAKFQRIVGGEVERINLIVQQLLEFARPVPPKLEPIDVSRLIDETLDLLANDLVRQHVGIHRDYGARTSRVLGDQQQLKQVFLNLFLNSLQAMNGDGRLTVGMAVEQSNLRITVADNGHGIAAQDLPRLFEPFFTTKPTGTGLGLAVVQGIINEHGGRIHVSSQSGRGTTVQLLLPLTT